MQVIDELGRVSAGELPRIPIDHSTEVRGVVEKRCAQVGRCGKVETALEIRQGLLVVPEPIGRDRREREGLDPGAKVVAHRAFR